jgi:hypothetical protein
MDNRGLFPPRPWLTEVERTTTLHTYGEPSREVDTGYIVETGTHPARMATDEFMAWLDSAPIHELEMFGTGRFPDTIFRW